MHRKDAIISGIGETLATFEIPILDTGLIDPCEVLDFHLSVRRPTGQPFALRLRPFRLGAVWGGGGAVRGLRRCVGLRHHPILSLSWMIRQTSR